MARFQMAMILAALSVIVAGSRLDGADATPPSAEITPPFTQLDLPAGPALPVAPARLPAPFPGQILVLWVAPDGKIRVQGLGSPEVIQVSQPQRGLTMAGFGSRSMVRVSESEVALNRSKEIHSDIAMAVNSSKLSQSRKEVSVGLSESDRTIQRDRRADNLVMRKADQGLANVAKDSGASSVGSAIGISGNQRFASLLSLDEQDILAALFEAGLLPGFFSSDRTRIVDDSMTLVSVEERDSFLRMVLENATLVSLLNRPLSESLRPAANAAASGPMSVAMKVIAEPAGRIYHGHPAAVSLNVTNESKLTAYDIMIVMSLPKHTSFEKSFEGQQLTRGYLSAYVAARQLFVLRLYRPLAPGETFRSGAMLKLDSWKLPEKKVSKSWFGL